MTPLEKVDWRSEHWTTERERLCGWCVTGFSPKDLGVYVRDKRLNMHLGCHEVYLEKKAELERLQYAR